MRFHLTEEQEAIQGSVRDALLGSCPPERRRALVNAGERFDEQSWTTLMELGVGGLALPESAGGSALGLLDLALVAEVIGEHAAPGPYIGHFLAGLALAKGSDEALAAEWLPKLATGEIVGAFVTDDNWTPDAWAIALEGGKVTGKAAFAPGADRADVLVVGTAGGGLVLVETASTGVTVETLDASDLTRSLAAVTFDGAAAKVVAPAGSPPATQVFDAALVLLAADALGGAKQCLDMTVDYAKTREQFGVVIGQFQAIKHQLANMVLELEPSRALVWYAAYAADAGLDDASHAAAHAKAHLAERFTSVTRAAVQAHGGIGYTWDYDLMIWLRRSFFDRSWLGQPSLHRERIAVMLGW